MIKQWPMVQLGDVLRRADRFEPRNDLCEYVFAGTYSFARGIFVGERKQGSTFALPKIQRIREGDFVYCKIMAWEGAFGIVPQKADYCVMSGAFVVYELNRNKIDPQFLDYYFKVPLHWQEIGRRSSGTNVRRQSLHPDQFEEAKIPLPPLNEQLQLVARIEEVAAQIDEARTLHKHTASEAAALMSSALGYRFSSLARKHSIRPLSELSLHILDGPHITPEYLPDGVTGVPFVTVKNMVTGKLNFSNINHISEEDHKVFTRRCKPEQGDVLYSKDGATRGRPCYVDTDREFSYFVSVALIKPLREVLDGHFLVHLLNSNWIKDRMTDKSRGDMIPHIVLREIRAFPVPALTISEQHRVVVELDALEEEVATMKRLQAETAAELEALLSAILDRAFKGQL